jgi:hypothetical protein
MTLWSEPPKVLTCSKCGNAEDLAQPFMDGVCVECLRKVEIRKDEQGKRTWFFFIAVAFVAMAVLLIAGTLIAKRPSRAKNHSLQTISPVPAPAKAVPAITYNEALQIYEAELREQERMRADKKLLNEMLDAVDAAFKNEDWPPDESTEAKEVRATAIRLSVEQQFKERTDANRAEHKAQQARIDDAKKLVDELRKSK